MIDYAMPEHLYHARPELSSTQARRILESPAKYHYGLTHPEEPKSAYDVGSAVHAKVLGVGSQVEVLHFDSYRTKAAQEARDAARDAGLVPMLAKDMAPIDAMAEAVLALPTARVLLEQEGHPEASVFSRDPETGVDLRARFDFLPAQGPRPIGVDLKTARDASKTGFARSAAEYGYDVQRAHYLDTLRYADDGYPLAELLFIVVEVEPPHLVAVHQLDREFAEIGKKKAAKARRVYADCTTSGVWGGYPDEVQLIIPPMWHVYDFQENHE